MVELNIPIKTCKNCGEIFVIGYNASVGLQFWLTCLTFIDGIIYWAIRGRSERCPRCLKIEFNTEMRKLEV